MKNAAKLPKIHTKKKENKIRGKPKSGFLRYTCMRLVKRPEMKNIIPTGTITAAAGAIMRAERRDTGVKMVK